MLGSLSIHSSRRMDSAIECFPSRLLMKRRSCEGVLSPLVTWVKSSRSSSSSERPVRFRIASFSRVYGSWSGTFSKMSATSSTTDGGKTCTTLANLVCCDVILRTEKIASNCRNQFLVFWWLYAGRFERGIATFIGEVCSHSSVAILIDRKYRGHQLLRGRQACAINPASSKIYIGKYDRSKDNKSEGLKSKPNFI